MPPMFGAMASGPNITPRTMSNTGQGGEAQPPYLQMRKPVPGQPMQGQAQTQPVITPKPMAPGDSVGTTPKPQLQVPQGSAPQQQTPGPQITPPGARPATPPQAGGGTLEDVYNFFKSDLENQRKQATANSVADASARGVYYGTPLTGSEADINTQYLRGLGQLQSGMYGNEQQNQLARLGLASNLGWQSGMQQPPPPGPIDFSSIASLLSGGTGPGASNPNTKRSGPVISPPSVRTGDGKQPAQTQSY